MTSKFNELMIGTMFRLQGESESLVKVTDSAIITGLQDPFNSIGEERYLMVASEQSIIVLDKELAESRHIDSQIKEMARKLHIIASVNLYE